MARSALLAALALALALVCAQLAMAQRCGNCQHGVCNTTISTTQCQSCYMGYEGSQCNTCKEGFFEHEYNGTSLEYYQGTFDGANLTICQARCEALHAQNNRTWYMGLFKNDTGSTHRCYCSSTYGFYGLAPSDGYCPTCQGNSSYRCGQTNTVSVYYLPIMQYRGCFWEPGAMTLCVEDMSTQPPQYSDDFSQASKILLGVFIGVCVVGGVYFIGLFFYCIHKKNAAKKANAKRYKSSLSSAYY